MKNKVKIYTLGCKVNQYDSAKLLRLLQIAGFDLVKNNADVAIINSCAVTKTAISKGQRMINKARKENPKAKIVLMGCWSEIYREKIKHDQIDLIWGVGEHQKLVKKISNIFSKNKLLSSRSKTTNFVINDDRSRYFIKIQDGCEQFCSYCIIPYTRGKLKSRSEKEILKEIEIAVDAGYREVVLCGIHLGLYKIKIKKGLVDLLQKIIKISKLDRVRLSSIEVTEVDDKLIKLIKTNKKICNHLHIPLQSGSDKILKLMNRPYSVGYFAKKIKQIRRLIPNIAITTDVIVGFPSETKNDFKDTCNFVKDIGFSRLHVFPFSAHEKTPAAEMTGQLDKKTKLDRARELRKIGVKLKTQYEKGFKNKIHEIIIESVIDNKIKGLNQYYFQIESKKSKIIEVKEGIGVGKMVKICF